MKTTKRTLSLLSGFILIFVALGCGTDEGNAEFPTDPSEATMPDSTSKPLKSLSKQQVEMALKEVRKEINAARKMGLNQMMTELILALKAKGFDTSVLAKIDDSLVGSEPATPPDPATSTTSADGYGQATFGLTKSSYKGHYKCPILAPEKTGNTPCDKLVQDVLAKVKDQIDKNKTTVESTIKKTYSDLDNNAQNFIAAWAFAAQQYGASVAATYAEHELKAAAKCDDKSNANEISYHLGVEQGWKIVLSLRAWAMSQVTSCVVNTDAIAQQVLVMAKAKIDAYMKANKTCEDADISQLNEAFKKAEVKRKTGIKKGIEQRVQILRNELFQARQNAPCPSSGGGGEPIVIDLDGDGLDLTTKRVKFDLLGDGTKQSCTWAGAREGFLALDRDGNGLVDSVYELMGNRSKCGSGLCYDGVDALKALDSNNDGVLDTRDAAFSKMLVWVDANLDGVSHPAEVTTLADQGIRSISLARTDMAVRNETGLVSAKLTVQTDKGPRQAYDVWFNVELTTQNLAGLGPR